MIREEIKITEGVFKGKIMTLVAIDEEAMAEAKVKMKELINNADVRSN